MARIRTIKPEFPHSESMGRVSRDARLLFVLLWTICDDSGRARAASRMLASLLFPYDDDAPKKIDGWLTELVRAECIWFYDNDGSKYLQVAKWATHQKIDKPSGAKCPPPSDEFARAREASRVTREHSSEDRDPDLDQDHDLERDRDVDREGSARGAQHAGKPRGARRRTLPDDWEPNDTHLRIATEQGVKILEQELAFRDHAQANARIVADWDAAFRSWLRNARKFEPRAGGRASPTPGTPVLSNRTQRMIQAAENVVRKIEEAQETA